MINCSRLSRSVRELDQILGIELFDRTRRGAQMTHKGKFLFEAIEGRGRHARSRIDGGCKPKYRLECLNEWVSSHNVN